MSIKDKHLKTIIPKEGTFWRRDNKIIVFIKGEWVDFNGLKETERWDLIYNPSVQKLREAVGSHSIADDTKFSVSASVIFDVLTFISYLEMRILVDEEETNKK